MKKVTVLILGFCLAALFIVPAFAQDLAPVSNEDFLNLLLQSLGGLSGLKSLGIAALVVQLLFKFIATPMATGLLGSVSGKVKLGIITVLGIASGVLSLMAGSGLTFVAALLHSSVLTTVMVYANQWVKQLAKDE